MGFDSARDASKPSDEEAKDRQSARFGWTPASETDDDGLDGGSETVSADETAPATFSGPSILGDNPESGQAYWTPSYPGDLPPTIIRRKKPAKHSELLNRYGKPVAAAITVAAVGSAGLLQAPQSAAAQPAENDENGDTGNIREGVQENRPALFDLMTDADDEGDTGAGQAVEERTEPIIYTVQPGDEVRKIARHFGLQTMSIVWNNELPNPDLILPGQELLIPPTDGLVVEVHPGDTIKDLASRFGVSTTAIINYEPNGISDPDIIQPGAIFTIPGGVPPQPLTEPQTDEVAAPDQTEPTGDSPEVMDAEPVDEISFEGDSIEVVQGDTLASVAQRFGVTIDELMQVNEIDDIDLIHPGDVLYKPNGEVADVVDDSQADPEPDVAEPVETEPAPEPEPTQEPEPTPTEPPQATATPAPDPTPTPEPEPEPEPEPTATPAPDPDPEPEQQQSSGVPSDIPGLLEHYANQYGIDANLLKAIAWRESGWNQSATSSMGAQGVMQIMPSTGTYINNNLVSRDLDIRGNAADNIEAGAAYLAQRINQMGSVERGVAAYFMGPVWVQNNGVTGAARTYVDRIFEIRDYIATHGEPPSWR